MPVWKTEPVDRQPEIILERWRIIGLPGGARHLVGYNRLNAEGRVSSAIAAFDLDQLVARTRSGRTYRLVGDPGWDADASYVLQRWCMINQVDSTAIEPIGLADLADLGPLE